MSERTFQVGFDAETIYQYMEELQIHRMYFNRWLCEDDRIWAAIFEGSVIACIALLHNEYGGDPMEKHKDPIILDYIFTSPILRRKGCALALINGLIHDNKYEITAYLDSSELEKLFKKAGFTFLQKKQGVFVCARYPEIV